MSSSVSATTSLTQQDFLKVLVSQYSNQIPTDAADSTEFYKNLMDLSNYQAVQTASSKVSDLSAQQLVGKSVTATDGDTKTDSGTITSARYDGTDWYFTIGSNEYTSSQITKINQSATTATTSTTSN